MRSSHHFVKILMLAPVVIGLLALAGNSIAGDKKSDVVKCGAELGKSPMAVVAEIMKDPTKFADKPVIMLGTVNEVCQKKGCWMEVMPDGMKSGVRVTFKDYGFFVPMDAHGMIVRAEGVFHTKVWSKEDADHMEGEGANLVRNADGTATEIGFIATGVELTGPKKPKAKPEAEPKADETKTEG
jgi:hypothetical protein